MSGIPAGAGQLLGKRLGKFEILALLALGGTAEIYLARIGGAAGFEKYVVVKCLHDHLADDVEFVKMFLDEARLAAHLDHSNIVQTMELGEHEGRYYMVMEFLAGLSLAMIVRRVTERMPTGRIPAPLVLNILAQAAAGLHYAHEKAMNGKALNIVHRDISPQNLVISFEGVVKLVDFGIAKAELRETRTRSGTIKGKFAYMSPEQCVANNVDRRTDVFALGVIGHELLTGRRLFKRPSPYETYQAVMECDVKPPSTADPEIDRALDQVIMRAITKDRADRYPSAEAFGDALLGYLHHRGIGSGPGDVSRFFDAHFGQEIDEHSGRMRELIAGRDVSGDTGMSWGSNDAGRDSDSGLAELAAASSGALTASRQSVGSLSFVLDGLGVGSRGEADDEMPAERTRIETNPLERFNELERMAARSGGNPDGPTQLAPSSAVPVPALPPMEAARAGGAGPQPQARPQAGQASRPAQSHAAQPHPAQSQAAQSSGAPGAPSSGRFPDLANLPTMIAGADPPSMVTGADPPTAETSPLPSLVGGGPPGALPAHARTQIASMPAAGTPASGAHAGNGALAGMPGAQGPPRSPSTSAPPPIGASPAQGYPVMNAALREQIATGATVFPSEVQRGGGPTPGGGMPVSGSGPGMPGPGMSGPGMSGPGMSGPGMPGQGMPPDASGPSMSPGPGGARGPDSGALQAGYPMQGGAMFDPQRAAEMMSPVGQHYPENVDWSSAAAGRARAVRPWLLATLFIGAIGIALLLTIVVARLVR